MKQKIENSYSAREWKRREREKKDFYNIAVGYKLSHLNFI
jgi:hypothetical protein